MASWLDWLPVIGAIGSSLVDAGSSVASSVVGSEEQYKYTKKLHEEDAARNYDYWQKQYSQQWEDQLKYIEDMRNYNTPQAQMARLKGAGINPNFLAAGAINNTSAGMPSSPSPSSVGSSSGVGLPLQNVNLDIAGKYAQLKLADAESKRDIAEANKSDKEANKLEITTPAEFSKTLQEIENLRSEKELTDKKKEEIDSKIAQTTQYIKLMAEQTKTVAFDAISRRIQAEAAMKTAKTSEGYYQKKIGADYISAHASMQQATAGMYNAETNAKRATADIDALQARVVMEQNKLEREFEKDGLQALEKAIKDNTFSVKIFGTGFDYTSGPAVARQLSVMSAGASYLEKYANKVSEEYKEDNFNLYEKVAKKFTQFVDKVKYDYGTPLSYPEDFPK